MGYTSPLLNQVPGKTMHLAATPALPSERKFGTMFAAIFVGLAAYGYWKGWAEPVCLAWGAAALGVALLTVCAPHWLAPLNKAWFRVGQLMGRIVSPVVLGALFFLVLTPIACFARLAGRDELRLKRVGSAGSYWVERTPPGPDADSFKNQF